MQTTAPLWNESFTFPLDAVHAAAPTAELRVAVYDWNRLMKHSLMGELVMPLQDIVIRLDETGRGMPAWYALSRPEHSSANAGGGSIYLQFSSSPMPATSAVTAVPAVTWKSSGPGDSLARATPSESLSGGGPFPSAIAPPIGSPVPGPTPASVTAPAALTSPSRASQSQSPGSPQQAVAAAGPAAPMPSALSTPARPQPASVAPDSADPGQQSPAALPANSASASPSVAPPQSAVGSVSPLAGGGAGAGVTGAGQEALAEGWQENWSKTKGKPYYSNRITGETRWKRPTLAPGSGTKRLM
jgi:hypothetical protein